MITSINKNIVYLSIILQYMFVKKDYFTKELWDENMESKIIELEIIKKL